MFQRISSRFLGIFAVCLTAASAHGLERVTYTNGLQDTFTHHEVFGAITRFYKSSDNLSWQDVKTERIVSITLEADPQPVFEATSAPVPATTAQHEAMPTMREINAMLSTAGGIHNVDADLLASVVKIESSFRVDARSKAGARGLMQLMPGTAKDLGVKDVTHPDDNIQGGAAYLDALLKQYHDDLPLTLAAYNAGPAAVAKYHGVPPYRETQWYVYRVIKEYNRRVKDRESSATVAMR